MDVSKQIVSAGAAHMCGMLLSRQIVPCLQCDVQLEPSRRLELAIFEVIKPSAFLQASS